MCVANFSTIFTGHLREEILLVLKALGGALKDKEHLIELNLSDNTFSPTGTEPMVDFLTHTRSLQILCLNNNGLGISGGTMIAKALLANAEKACANNRSSSLRSIICSCNHLEDGSSEALANTFATHGTLIKVCMLQNGICPDGICHLTRGLFKNPNLHMLDLQDNTFTKCGCLALTEALTSWSHLYHLNVGKCLLSNKSGVAIADALILGKNQALKDVNLSYNEIESDAITCLTKAIAANLPNLDALDELDDMEDESEEEEKEEEEEEEEEEGKKDKEDRVVESVDMEANLEPVRKANKEEEKEEKELSQKLSDTYI
ncbi:hypothetical protein BC936DRAFT_144450 [Jimgerdemannia flammicorona]|uniref:Ran GTPase-activating protein 1 n=1 Tax=Jimgerdemannia flammicorona TaxID=994334 RepID=A0A433DCF9_9FUNG|nr:hypothetical protein BC936DRAFT_144450 [Jimgerdemannia flammicorona]